MPGPQPPTVPLSEAERHARLTRRRAHTTPQHCRDRAPIRVLGAGRAPGAHCGPPLGAQPPPGAARATALAHAPWPCGARALPRCPAPGGPGPLQRRTGGPEQRGRLGAARGGGTPELPLAAAGTGRRGPQARAGRDHCGAPWRPFFPIRPRASPLQAAPGWVMAYNPCKSGRAGGPSAVE
jgi:hypothetical protein